MEIKELRAPDSRKRHEIEALLTNAFWRTPLFYKFLFHGRKRPARVFLAAMLRYALVAGRVFTACTEDGQPVACALWSTPESPDITVKTLFTLRLWPHFLLLLLLSPAALARVRELFSMLDTYAPQTPCATLEFLASDQKGAGAAVARYGMEAFAEIPLYVESIVSKNDHAFYRGLGFKPFAHTDFHGTAYAFLLRAPSEDQPSVS